MGVHKITDRGTFPQEFRAGYNREWYRLGLVAGDDLRYPVAGAHGYCGFVDDDQPIWNGSGYIAKLFEET